MCEQIGDADSGLNAERNTDVDTDGDKYADVCTGFNRQLIGCSAGIMFFKRFTQVHRLHHNLQLQCL